MITFDSADGETHGLLVKGFNIINNSAASSGSYVGSVLSLLDQGSGNYGPYQHPVVFDDCNFRLTLNTTAAWYTAFWVRANHWLTLRNCRCIVPSNFGGGNYYRYICMVTGNADTARSARLSIKGGEYAHGNFAGATNATVGASGPLSSAFAHRATFSRTPSNGLYLLSDGGVATGFTVSEAEAYGNLLGVNAVEF